MKKIFLFFTAAAFISCNSNDDAKVESMSASDTSANVTYPYEITYSSKFEIGDPRLSQKVLELWKDFDNGDISKHRDYFADSVRLLFPDGSSMFNTRDSVIAATNAYRGMYSSVASKVEAVLPTRIIDKDENWVSVWGVETHTANGKTDSAYLHESWRFNKEGRIDFMMQYLRSAPKK